MNRLGVRGVLQWVFALAALGLMWLVGCGAASDDAGESLGSAALSVITGTGPCRTSTITATAVPERIIPIVNGSEPTISPAINGMFPQELTVLSGDATAFGATLKTTSMSGTTTVVTSCAYGPAGPYRMLRASCSGIAVDAVRAFSNLALELTANVEGGSIALQASVSALEDNKRCTYDSCDPTTGVAHSNVPAGTSCSVDNNVCNGVETCNGTGTCTAATNAAAGTPCSDGNQCNGFETCSGAGACAAGTPLGNGTSCSDGNFCNGEERCTAGVCQPGTAPSASLFDDRNACTADSCDPFRGGIVNDPIAGCATTAGAAPVDQTSSPSFASSTAFLYTGASPVQTGVAAGVIASARSAVIRGRVLAADGITPASGASVTILNHAEYGQTLTRSDGYYDLAVNGGGPLTVEITAPMRSKCSAAPT